nr:helix-turn-helix transcriptional regulator [Desulfovibrio sp.]
MPDYRNMTAVDAVRHAKDLSGMTAEEIATASGLGVASVTRYFRQGEDYGPSLKNIPALCRAMGNTILIDWLLAQTGRDFPVEPAKSRAEVLTSVARAVVALGDASRILADTDRGG